MIRSAGKSPKLKIKAAESRYMLPVIRFILENYFPVNTDYLRLRLQCVVAVDEMYKLMRVPDAEFDGLLVAKFARQHLILYGELGKIALETCQHQQSGWILWRWYPKHHLFSHFETQVAQSGSPSESWCYRDESAIGDCVHVAESCHPNTLHRLVIDKHRIPVEGRAIYVVFLCFFV